MSKLDKNCTALHELLAEVLKDELKRQVKEGEINPSFLNQARQFLKDNDYVGSNETNEDINDLVDTLKDFDEEDKPLRLAK